MRPLPLWLGILGTLALAGLPAPAGAQAVGSEFQVNTFTTANQRARTYGGHMVASDASGNFVVVWRSNGQDGSGYGVFGQRYDRSGVALGSEFRVNSYTTNNQVYPSVAAARDGHFVVTWHSFQDGSGYGVFGQRYDRDGVVLGEEFRVNTHTTNNQSYSSVAAASEGNFVVVWNSFAQDGSDYGVFGQRYDRAGVAVGGEFLVNSYTTSNQYISSVASDASGNFVVVWQSLTSEEDDYRSIFGQRYDRTGVALGDEFHVNSYTPHTQALASVASDSSGNFVVVWNSRTQDGSGFGVFGQRYDRTGVTLGNEFRINSFTLEHQSTASVASDANGNFVVVWRSFGQDGSNDGIFGQRYDSDGVAQGDEFQINSYTTGQQNSPSVWMIGPNQFVVAWDSVGQDGSGFGVFGRRLGRERERPR